MTLRAGGVVLTKTAGGEPVPGAEERLRAMMEKPPLPKPKR